MTKQTRQRQVRQAFAQYLAEQFDLSPEHPRIRQLSTDLATLAFPHKDPTRLQLMTGALGRILGLDVNLNSGRLHALAAEVLQSGYTTEQLEAWYSLENKESPWCRDWRSRRGTQPPSERDFRGTVALFARQAEADARPMEV